MADVVLGGFKRVQLNWGENLQNLAARVLGDASLWVKIAEINRLAPPYVTGDPAAASEKVVLYGDTLMIPAPAADIQPGKTFAEDVFQQDVSLPGGRLLDNGSGDFAIVAGHENLKQALEHRVRTDEGELLFHQNYGCKAGRLRGKRKDEANVIMAREFVAQAVLLDDRIAKILTKSAVAVGDAVQVELTAQTATGHPVDLSVAAGV